MEALTKSLPVKLTDAELRDRAKALGEKIAERRGLEAQKKLSADNFKTLMEKADIKIAELGEVGRTGEEYRQIPIITRKNFDRSLVETVRTDTGEVVDSRAMTQDERQAGLFEEDESVGNSEEEPKRSRRGKAARETQPEA